MLSIMQLSAAASHDPPLSLTEVGAAVYEHCARVVQEAEEAALLVDRLQAKPRGVLKCTAPVAFATLHIASVLPDFLSIYPDVHLDLTVGDRFFELAEEGYDVAIRIARELSPNGHQRQGVGQAVRQAAARHLQSSRQSLGSCRRFRRNGRSAGRYPQSASGMMAVVSRESHGAA